MLICIKNYIKEISDDIGNLTSLEFLNLAGNNLTSIPKTIGKVTSLEIFNVVSNNITRIPNEIINCRRMRGFSYYDTEIEYISPQVNRFLNRLMNIGTYIQVYNDKQNIHNHSIQSSVSNSISNIMNNKLINNETIIITQIINDEILTEKTKGLIMEYCSDKDYHSVLLITFKELLLNVWEIIESNAYKNEIKAILNTEMEDSECKCFTGRLSRLVNSLNGFTDLVEIKISINQQIGNIIIIIKNELEFKNKYTVEKHKELVENELKSRGYEENIINEWVDQIV